MRHHTLRPTLLLLFAITTATAAQQKKPRARDLGVPFDGTPGPLNAITDIAGIEVGQTTVIFGEGKLERGKGPARTQAEVVQRVTVEEAGPHRVAGAGLQFVGSDDEFRQRLDACIEHLLTAG